MFCISLWNSLPSDSDVTGSPTLASFKYLFFCHLKYSTSLYVCYLYSLN